MFVPLTLRIFVRNSIRNNVRNPNIWLLYSQIEKKNQNYMLSWKILNLAFFLVKKSEKIWCEFLKIHSKLNQHKISILLMKKNILNKKIWIRLMYVQCIFFKNPTLTFNIVKTSLFFFPKNKMFWQFTVLTQGLSLSLILSFKNSLDYFKNIIMTSVALFKKIYGRNACIGETYNFVSLFQPISFLFMICCQKYFVKHNKSPYNVIELFFFFQSILRGGGKKKVLKKKSFANGFIDFYSAFHLLIKEKLCKDSEFFIKYLVYLSLLFRPYRSLQIVENIQLYLMNITVDSYILRIFKVRKFSVNLKFAVNNVIETFYGSRNKNIECFDAFITEYHIMKLTDSILKKIVYSLFEKRKYFKYYNDKKKKKIFTFFVGTSYLYKNINGFVEKTREKLPNSSQIQKFILHLFKKSTEKEWEIKKFINASKRIY